MCEYALYIKGGSPSSFPCISALCVCFMRLTRLPSPGLILRHRGRMTEALDAFQTVMRLDPNNSMNAKQVARTLFVVWEGAGG